MNIMAGPSENHKIWLRYKSKTKGNPALVTHDLFIAFQIFAILVSIDISIKIHLFPELRTFWFLEKTGLHENCVMGLYQRFN